MNNIISDQELKSIEEKLENYDSSNDEHVEFMEFKRRVLEHNKKSQDIIPTRETVSYTKCISFDKIPVGYRVIKKDGIKMLIKV